MNSNKIIYNPGASSIFKKIIKLLRSCRKVIYLLENILRITDLRQSFSNIFNNGNNAFLCKDNNWKDSQTWKSSTLGFTKAFFLSRVVHVTLTSECICTVLPRVNISLQVCTGRKIANRLNSHRPLYITSLLKRALRQATFSNFWCRLYIPHRSGVVFAPFRLYATYSKEIRQRRRFPSVNEQQLRLDLSTSPPQRHFPN